MVAYQKNIYYPTPNAIPSMQAIMIVFVIKYQSVMFAYSNFVKFMWNGKGKCLISIGMFEIYHGLGGIIIIYKSLYHFYYIVIFANL